MSKINPEVRANIRERCLDSVAELSDLLYQEATWGLIDNPHFTFVEFAECFFDTLPEGVDDSFEAGVISDEEREAIRPLWNALSNYSAPKNDDYDVVAILADPKWHSVVQTAEVCRRELLTLLGPDERKFLSIEEQRSWSPKGDGPT